MGYGMMERTAELIDRTLLLEILAPRIPDLRTQIERKIPLRLRRAISADDILQEVWIAADRTVSNFKAYSADAVDRWLTSIVSSKVHDALKATRRVKRGGDWRKKRRATTQMSSCADLFAHLRSPQQTPSKDIRWKEAAHLVLSALERLNDNRRQAFEMRYFDGLSYKEIAERTGKTVGAVSSLLLEARRDLRDILGPAGRYLSDTRSTDDAGADEPAPC